MIGWLLERTIGCFAPADVGAGLKRWACEHNNGDAGGGDKTVYRVTITAAAIAITEIDAEVDQSANPDLDPQKTQGFLADTIGASPPVGSARGASISNWVDKHFNAGGSVNFGGIQVILTPFGGVTQLKLTFPSP
jgi:hypothetical protein